jgi:hypothetical protein
VGVAQITRAQRIERINQLLAELNKQPPERHAVEELPWGGGPLLCPVIKLPADEVLLNHRSHRVRAQLEDDPEWQAHENDPHSEAAQRIIERHVRAARTEEEFNRLKLSLLDDGQSAPGVMTHDGVLVNANTRAVAMREFEDPGKKYIKVAVLPQTAQREELALLELRLQMQKELKVDYSLTNELLFIEELSSERHLTNAQIARELRLFPESEKKGINEIAFRLQALDLIREMQKIPTETLPLTFFDKISYEHLRDVLRTYESLLQQDPAEAREYLETFLLSIACDVTPVHQTRRLDASFMPKHMLPQLEEDEVLGEVAGQLVAPNSDKPTAPTSSGSDALLTSRNSENGEEQKVDLKQLIDVVTRRDKRVQVAGTPLTIGQDDVKQAIKSAIITGIKDKRLIEKEADKLEAPSSSVKKATRDVTQAVEAVRAVAGDPDFDAKRQKTLEAAYKKLKRTMRDLEQQLVKSKIIAE